MVDGTVESFQMLHGQTPAAGVACTVVNDQLLGAGMATPKVLVARALTVKVAPRARLVVGVNVAVLVFEL